MKRMRMYLSSCFVLFMIAALLSCSRPIPPVPSPSISNSASDKRYFTEATGIKLGEKAQLLKYEKDREMLNGLEDWVIYFASDINENKIVADVDWLELRSLQSSVEVIEKHLSPRKIGKPIKGYHAEWKKNQRLIQADMLRTDDGTYVEVIGAPN